ncbi:hypothetical protein [Yeosuana sp. AK3]
MKTQIKISILFSIMLMFFLSSCRTEELVSIQTPPEDTLTANSNLTSLMSQTVMNDGSNDNIIDNSNCFNIELPVTVIVNGIEITVNSVNDYKSIEDIFDEFDDDLDAIEITFPITIVLSDFTEITINNFTELSVYSNNCHGENESDDDIECLDFVYPLTVSIFNRTTEVITTVTINDDQELYNFIDDFDEVDDDDDLVTFNFPISIVLLDGTELTINNFDDLEEAINLYGDDCDEDDDFDYNDDDCDNCSTNQLTDILTGCSEWTIEDLERNDNDLEDLYEGYIVNFLTDGTLTVTYAGTIENGTWSTSGAGNNISFIIDIPTLSDFNNQWNLHEIEQSSSETKVDFRVGDDDELKFKSNCN